MELEKSKRWFKGYVIVETGKKGYIELPAPRVSANNNIRNKVIKSPFNIEEPLETYLKSITPIKVKLINPENGKDLITIQTIFFYWDGQYILLMFLLQYGIVRRRQKLTLLDGELSRNCGIRIGKAIWKSAKRPTLPNIW